MERTPPVAHAASLLGSDSKFALAYFYAPEHRPIVLTWRDCSRFTTSLAQTARHVLSTDFIESFIVKNRERNEKLGNTNVSFQVGDAVHLKLDDERYGSSWAYFMV